MTVLEFAEHAAAFTAVFVSPPGQSAEFRHPTDWSCLDPGGNDVRLKEWRYGDAVCALTGQGFVVVDVDPQNGGDVSQVGQTLDALGIRVYAEVATPGGGRHFYVAAHPDLPTSRNLDSYPGVDVQSHGAMVYLPGTCRPKYGGGEYQVVFDNLEALADGGDPDGAEALAHWVATHRPTRDTELFTASPPWDGTPPDQRQQAYLAAVLDGQRQEVASAAPGHRNSSLYAAALKCGSFVKGAGLDANDVRSALIDAATANGLLVEDGERSVRATIASGLRAAQPRQVPDPVTVLGPSLDASTGEQTDATVPWSRVTLTAASTIKPKPVRWLWDQRLALGTLGLLAGREGLGKSTLAYWLAAQVTLGRVPGEHYGQPKAVLVCATEDSWEHTIVPRLMAAGGDLDRVYRVEVVTADNLHFGLSLPRDLPEMAAHAHATDAALLLLDPLMSRLSDTLDTHRDGDVRRALEPLVAAAERTRMAVLGLIHHNKSGSTDPLQLVMASKAFTAVARSVHTVIPDPDDDTGQQRLFGTPKNNLGRDNLPALAFTITGHAVPTDDGDAWTARIEWGQETNETITDTMRRAGDSDEVRTAVTEAADWLSDYVTSQGGVVPSADAKKHGHAAGHSEHALQKARKKLHLWVKSEGYPRATYWGDPALADRDPT